MDGKNVGEYDPDRLKKFIVVCKKWGKLSKVHNADFLQAPIIKHMFALGVDAINIAPEFGQIESSSNDNKNCSKWFSKTPDYSTQKDCDLVMHYIYSKPEFVEIKEKYSETSKLDCKIKEKLKKRIWEVLDKSVSTFKQIAFDLDDVICLRPKGHENEGVRKYQYCCPIKEGVELVNKCYRYGYYVKIFTSRGMTQFNGDVAKIYNELFITTKNQLETWGVLHHELIMGKPHADIYVGDEAVRWKPGLTMDGLK